MCYCSARFAAVPDNFHLRKHGTLFARISIQSTGYKRNCPVDVFRMSGLISSCVNSLVQNKDRTEKSDPLLHVLFAFFDDVMTV